MFLVTVTSDEQTKFLQDDRFLARQFCFVAQQQVESITLGTVPTVQVDVYQPQRELALK